MKKQINFIIYLIIAFSCLICSVAIADTINLEKALVDLGLDVKLNKTLERIEANAKGINLAFISNSNYYRLNDSIRKLNNPVIAKGREIYIEKSDFEKLKQEHLSKIEESQKKGNLLVEEIEPNKNVFKKPVITTKESIIVIDPGHGGRDPGAIGYRGTKEKDINLQIGLRLKKKIEEKSDNIKVLLTRKKDIFISLSERTKFANKYNADLFVSIHCNANVKKDASGFEVYFLNPQGSKDEKAAIVAKLENSAIKYEKNQNSDLVERILSDMLQQAYIKNSTDLANIILSKVKRNHLISGRGIYSAMFYVLRDAAMPAVLIESGFITNRKEEKLLKTSKFQESLADVIADALIQYLKEYKKL